jgi:hypothetical protein
MKKKIIKFASELDFINLPKPSAKYIPDWYKKTKVNIEDVSTKIQSGKTFKHCVPFLDAISSGYIYELYADLEVEKTAGFPNLLWRSPEYDMISNKQDGSSGMMDIPNGYSSKLYSFNHQLYIKTPPGYSVLITQPFNRTDLPFYALSGIVDTDKSPMFPGGYPIFLKDNFEGIIEKGTPILQIIPFKRERWKSENSISLLKEGGKTYRMSQSVIEFWYKKNAWFRKSYE